MNVREFVKQVNDNAKAGLLSRVTHHLQGSILVREAKPLGFNTRKVMVRIHRGEWVTVDPITWNVTSTDRKL